MEPLGSQAIEAGEILIAEQLQYIVHVFEEHRAIDLPSRNIPQVGGTGTELKPLPGTLRNAIVSQSQCVIQTPVEKTRFEQFDIREFQNGQDILSVFVHHEGGVPIDDRDVV